MPGILRPENYRSRPAFSFADFESQARSQLDQAREQARQIVTQARKLAEQRARQIEQQAHQRGLEEGRREGLEQIRREAAEQARQEARQRYAQLAESLQCALREFDQSKRRLLALAESGLIELALAIARRVCKLQAGRDSQTARANVRAALELARHENDLEVLLSPEDYQCLSETFPQLLAEVGLRENVRLLADPAVAPGGCVLRSRSGTIDAQIETQLDRIARALLEQTP